MPASAVGKMNVREFLAWSELPENDGRSFELDRGEVIEMSRPGPKHGLACSSITRVLANYLDAGRAGDLLTNDTGLVISDDTLRGPDIMLFDIDLPPEALEARFCELAPVLCVEVISPTNRPIDIARKINQYLARGVRLVWLADPEERSVHVFQANELPKLLDETDTLTGNGILPGFSSPVADLFRRPRNS